MFQKIVFANGLKLILVPQKFTKTLTILILVKTGSKYEQKDENGISHFLEHMCFKGTKKRPSPILISEPLDSIGALYNAFTSQEYTGFWIKADSSHFDLILDIISDLFLNPILPEQEIEKEKKVIEEEINMVYDNPQTYLDLVWLKVLYGDQPAGWPITGSKQTVKNMSREKLINYRQSQYIASNTLICVAGNFNKKIVIKKIKKAFEKIRLGKPRIKPPVFQEQKRPEILIEQRKLDQTHLALGVKTFGLFDERKYVLEIIARILGGMMSSRLFLKIREEMGACYYIACSVALNPDDGFLVVEAGISHENLEKVILAILKEFKKLTEEKVSLKELKKSKENIIGKLILSLESSDAKASFYGIQELLENKIETPEQIIKKIKRVSAEQIRKLAKEIFKAQKLNLAMISPVNKKENLEKIFKI